MMKHIPTTCLILGIGLSAVAAKQPPVPSYLSAKDAIAAKPDFSMIGEYVSQNGKTAIQANMQPDGTFLVAEYAGGLPGQGWDQSPIKSSLKKTDELWATLKDFRKVERQSPTLGKAQPANAILKFPDDFTNVKDGLLMAGGKTSKDLGSFSMHLEFLMPFKPDRTLSSQDRGNSGIYIFHNYEVQVLDAFGLDFENAENNAIELKSDHKQWCGCLYKKKLPDVNMCYPPLRWQTYDIDFTAPAFEGDKKVQHARITIRHNGVLIHDDVELEKGTGAGAKKPQLAEGPLFFQSHGTPVMFRNVWATEL